MAKYEYESVLNVPTDAEPSKETTSRPSPRFFLKKTVVFPVMLLLAAIALCLVLVANGRSTRTSISNVPMLGSPDPAVTVVAGCTFDQCYASNCNHEVAPYTCLFHNGGPHGGCSSVPWESVTCDKQCDLSGCEALDIPESAENCNVKCDKSWCANQARLCGKDAPFQCTSGSATFGCSADTFAWTFKSASTTCSACCDASLCD